MRLTVAALLIAMLCSCSIVSKLENESPSNIKHANNAAADKWVGRTVDEMIVSLGAPTNIYQSDSGNRIFEYFEDALGKPTWTSEPVVKRKKLRISGASRVVTVPVTAESTDSTQNPGQPCKILFTISASDVVEKWAESNEGCN